jgi:protein disulfide-isomerase
MGKKFSFLLVVAFLALLGMNFSQAGAEECWLTSLDEAKKIAKDEGKDIIVNFCGSDWCQWCIKLDKEVFSKKEWKREAAKKYVMVMIDSPKNKKLDKEQDEYNKKLVKEFGVKLTGYPTIYILDSKGMPYARTGYQLGGPEKYLSHLEDFESRKAKKDELFRKWKDASPEDKPKLIENTLKKLTYWDIDIAYGRLKDDLIGLDSENKSGFGFKYASQLAKYYYVCEDKGKSESYVKKAKKMDESKGKDLETEIKILEINNKYLAKQKWSDALDSLKEILDEKPKGEIGQQVYYYAGICAIKMKDNDRAVDYLEKGLNCAPNSELSDEIQNILKQLNAFRERNKPKEEKQDEPF